MGLMIAGLAKWGKSVLGVSTARETMVGGPLGLRGVGRISQPPERREGEREWGGNTREREGSGRPDFGFLWQPGMAGIGGDALLAVPAKEGLRRGMIGAAR